ncbi:MAG: glycosyltransferase family 4 protein [Verrucomicrobiia bacterium]
MNFALFTTTFFPIVGGAEKQLDLLARGLLARGHSPLVIAPWVPGKIIKSKRLSDLSLSSNSLQTMGPSMACPISFSTPQKIFIRLIHSQGAYPAGYMASAFAKRHAVPLIIRAYGGDVLPGEAIASSWWLNRRLKKP